MTAPEKFREAEPLEDDQHNILATVMRAAQFPCSDRTLCRISYALLDATAARALRDWLTEVLP